jgi:hypothetical protein
VEAGKETPSVDIGLLTVPLARVSGSVVDSRGRPSPDVIVWLNPARADGALVPTGAAFDIVGVDAAGRFALSGIPPGDYRLDVQAKSRMEAIAKSGSSGVGMSGSGPVQEFASVPVTVNGENIDSLMVQTSAGARMTEIAREAGVNHALLHYYFRSKQRLAEAVFRRAIGQFFPLMIGVLTSDAPLEDKVRRVAAAQIDMLLANRFLPGYLLAELNHYPERAEQLLSSMSGTTPRRRACSRSPQIVPAVGLSHSQAAAAAGSKPRWASSCNSSRSGW